MKTLVAFVCANLAFVPAVIAASPAQPPVPAAKPVTETIFGTKVTDAYRYFEQQGPEVVDWMPFSRSPATLIGMAVTRNPVIGHSSSSNAAAYW